MPKFAWLPVQQPFLRMTILKNIMHRVLMKKKMMFLIFLMLQVIEIRIFNNSECGHKLI